MEEGSEGVQNTTDDDIVKLVDSAADHIVDVVQVAQDSFQEAFHLLLDLYGCYQEIVDFECYKLWL